MTAIQNRAVSLIQSMRDEQLYDVIRQLTNVLEADAERSEREQAFAYWESMRRPAAAIDYKSESAQRREERYGRNHSN